MQQVVKYEYDSLGLLISVKDANGNIITDQNNIGNKNPYRYRGYRYDTETGMYYLQSRYYNPDWGRFLNADGTTTDTGAGLIGHNMYVYCANNPVNCFDPTGTNVHPFFENISQPTREEFVKKTEERKAKIFSNAPGKKNTPDYSKKIDKVVKENISIVKEKNMVIDILWFKSQVTHDGPWDYKLKTQWEEGIGTDYLQREGEFVWDGQVMNAEQFGNMHYGIVGTAMGYYPIVLFIGGGYAQSGVKGVIHQALHYGEIILKTIIGYKKA